jgi:hypothetical protein
MTKMTMPLIPRFFVYFTAESRAKRPGLSTTMARTFMAMTNISGTLLTISIVLCTLAFLPSKLLAGPADAVLSGMIR